MSEHFLALIPVNPDADLPGNAEALRACLGRMLGSAESRVKDYGKLQFIDCGEDFKSLTCPACSAAIPREDWQGWMAADWHGEEGFHLHRHDAPCCGAGVTLNDLVYEAAQGFSRWFIGVRLDPARPLSPESLAELSERAGLPLRAIRQRY